MRLKLFYIFAVFCLAWTTGLQAQQVYTAMLSGQQEVGPVISPAKGMVTATLTDNKLVVEGSFDGLMGEFDEEVAGGAHIHDAIAGQNGGIALGLTTALSFDLKSGSFEPSTNTFELTAEQLVALRNRGFYVNIHSTSFPGGELRGQLLPQGDFQMQSLLTGHQEVPAVFSTGYGVVMMDISGNNLTVSGSFSGLTTPFDPNVAGGAHIHIGSVGRNGDVAVLLNATVDPDGSSGVFEAGNNTFELDSETLQAIINREAYVNIHTTGFPGGEIRGQITSMATSIWKAGLSGVNQNPFVDSRGHGSLMIEYNAFDNSIVAFGTFNNMESGIAEEIAGGAHIHIGYAGQNGPVVYALESILENEGTSGVFSAAANEFLLGAEELPSFLQRATYVNVHSDDNNPGELRGQILPLAQYHFNAYLGGSQEVPSVVSSGNGAVKVEWTNGQVAVTGSFTDLINDFDSEVAGGAHIHFGLPGQNGDIALVLGATVDEDKRSGVFTSMLNTFEIDAPMEDAFMNRASYVNIHTNGFPGGEVRGQVLHEAHGYYQSSLTGSQEVPAVLTSGRGSVMMERVGNELRAIGTFSGLQGEYDSNIAGGAHIHRAFAGTNGDIVVGLTPIVAMDGLSGIFSPQDIIEINDEIYEQLTNRELYVNIHTTEVASGEIRGQITGQQVALFRAFLAGSNEVHAVESGASGSVLVELSNGNILTASGSFNGLESQLAVDIAGGAHIHTGLAGANGPVSVVLAVDSEDGLNGVFSGVANRLSIEPEVKNALVSRRSYVNVHSEENQAGEIRGQLNGDANYVFSAVLSGTQEVPSVTSPGNGAIKVEWNGSQIIVSGSATLLWDDIATEIAGGAHIHIGLPGENGDVAIVLNIADGAEDLEFLPENNTFTLDSEQQALLEGRNMYVNLHTLLYPSGEIRGQLMREALAYYQTNLYGGHEVPAVLTTGNGAIQMEWDGQQLISIGRFSDLMGDFDVDIAGGAHIHTALPGRNGDILVGINATLDDDLKGGTFLAEDNVIETNEEIVELIRNRALYVNIHTTEVPSGEIRGQIFGQTTALLRAYLAGANEVPSVMSNGSGVVHAEYRPDYTIKYYGTFEGLTGKVDTEIAGGAHIHLNLPGRNGDILFPLTFDLSDDGTSGEFNTQVADLEDLNLVSLSLLRFTYVNIHTTEFAPGEIRGQLMGESQYEFTGTLSSLQEVNPVLSIGNGVVKGEWSGDRISITGSVQNLFADIDTTVAGGAHLHTGLPGRNGGIVGNLTPDLTFNEGATNAVFIALDNIVSLDEEAIADLMDRKIYANIHSELYPGGEVRAQMMGEAATYMMANLGGSHEAPEVNTPAAGTVLFEKNDSQVRAVGSFNNLMSPFNVDVAGGAHIHIGLAGSNGDVSQFLTTNVGDGGSSGAFDFADNEIELADSLLASREYYVNVHSTDHPGGEVRGQVLPILFGAFTANLSGSNEVPFIESNASGQLLAEFNGATMRVSGTFADLSAPVDTDIAGGAHLHLGGPGENGEVTVVLNPDLRTGDTAGSFKVSDNTFELDIDQLTELYFGGLYANIHTTEFASGELRGQVLPVINFYPQPDAVILTPEDGAELTLEGLPDTEVVVSWEEATDRDELVYLWELSTDEDFETTVLKLNVGSSTMLTFSFEDLDALLETNMVPEGGTITLYHRAIATDGSLQTPGQTAVLTLTRGIFTSTAELDVAGNTLRVLPNVVSTGTEARIEIETDMQQVGQVNILDINGKVVYSQNVQATNGITSLPLNANKLQPGMFFLQWVQSDGNSKLVKFMVSQ